MPPLRSSFYLSSLEGLVLAQQCSIMLRPHGVPGNRLSQQLWLATQSLDRDNLFTSAPRLRTQLVQLQTTISEQMNKPVFLLKPLGSALRKSTTAEEACHLHPEAFPQAAS